MYQAILISTALWFATAAILFFNPIVDKIYKPLESNQAVRPLPSNLYTIGRILIAIFIQCVLWAFVYKKINNSLGDDIYQKGMNFGIIIIAIKLIPRDIDRILLSYYPMKRILIEFIIGIICAFAVSFVYCYYI